MIAIAIDIWTRVINGFGGVGGPGGDHITWADIAGDWASQTEVWSDI